MKYPDAAGIDVVPQAIHSNNAGRAQANAHYPDDGLILHHPKVTVDEVSWPLLHTDLAAGRNLAIASRRLPLSRNEDDGQLVPIANGSPVASRELVYGSARVERGALT